LTSIGYAGMSFYYLMPHKYNVYFNSMNWSIHIAIFVVTLASILLPKVKSD
jgi:hypothetical protein